MDLTVSHHSVSRLDSVGWFIHMTSTRAIVIWGLEWAIISKVAPSHGWQLLLAVG